MAIELHHLHPGHDDELSRLKARIAEPGKLYFVITFGDMVE